VNEAVRRHPSSLGPDPSGRRRRVVVLAAVAVAIVTLTALFAFGLGQNPEEVRSPLVGRQAPDFDLQTLDGSRSVRLSSLRGQVGVLNFWASWCAECLTEHPALDTVWRRFRDQGVVVLGVTFEDARTDAARWARARGVGWPVLADPGSRTALAYGVSGVPETLFIGPDGRVAAKRVGPVTLSLLTERIGRLLRA
jgi:cytochrome c biogenesis protein CcmG/thiol:disulfide interchange protein DsbE